MTMHETVAEPLSEQAQLQLALSRILAENLQIDPLALLDGLALSGMLLSIQILDESHLLRGNYPSEAYIKVIAQGVEI